MACVTDDVTELATTAPVVWSSLGRGHGNGWYAEFKKVDEWKVAQTLRTTARELSSYATDVDVAS